MPHRAKGLVMVVDDDPVAGEAMTQQLRDRGYHAAWAANGDSALARLKVTPTYGLILDHYMPGLDGLGLLRRLRGVEAYRRLPVVMLTAAAGGEADALRGELAALPPAALVRKPAEIGDVLAVLEDVAGATPLAVGRREVLT